MVWCVAWAAWQQFHQPNVPHKRPEGATPDWAMCKLISAHAAVQRCDSDLQITRRVGTFGCCSGYS